jgi:16S rRNA (uracil1498-N3)-methyltransferase
MEVVDESEYEDQFIAHCLPGQKNSFREAANEDRSTIILIGPEGDFSPEEIETALEHHFKPVALGETRLRTETAGMVAAALLYVH